jgi:hypothetical protein
MRWDDMAGWSVEFKGWVFAGVDVEELMVGVLELDTLWVTTPK